MNFSTCVGVQIFNFRDGHVTTFRHHSGACICQIPGQTLQTSKCTPSEPRLFIGRLPLVWGKTVPCSLCAVQSKCTLKREKCCFWIWLRPRYKIPEFLTISPVLTSTLTVCRRSVVSIYYIGLRVRYDRGPSRPTSVFRIQQYVCAKFIQIG